MILLLINVYIFFYRNPTCVTSKLVSKHWEPVTDPRVFQCMNIGKNLFMEDVLNIEERLNLKKNKI